MTLRTEGETRSRWVPAEGSRHPRPMDHHERLAHYHATNRCQRLTPRQERRARHKFNRAGRDA